MITSKFSFQSPLSGTYLRDVLQKKSQNMRSTLEKGVPKVLQARSDENEYISSVIKDFQVNIPQLDFEPDHIRKSDNYEEVHGSQLAGEVIFPDRLYRMWVVTFRIPYTGDIGLLQHVPRSGSSLSSLDVFIDSQYVSFKARTLDRQDKDTQKIKDEKERTISFLEGRLEAIIPELEEYNTALEQDVRAFFESQKQKYLKDKDLLGEL